MPHRCVRCGKTYEDCSEELLKGCSQCSSRFFLYVKKVDLEKAEQFVENLTPEDKQQREEDVKELIGKESSQEEDLPVILNFESIRIVSPGKYHLDLTRLFNGNPVVYRLEEGKYYIDIAGSFPKKKS